MGRNSLVKIEQANEIAEEMAIPLDKLGLSRGQREVIGRITDRIVAASAHLQKIEREIIATKNKIAASDETKYLKTLKQQRKTLQMVHKDSSNLLNGAYELAMGDIEGDSYQEKLKKLKN